MPNIVWSLNATPEFGQNSYHWRMDEKSGTTLLDDLNSQSITHNGTYATGAYGNTAVYFNGTNDRAYKTGTLFSQGTSAFSLAWWLNCDWSPGVYEEFCILSKFDVTQYPGYAVYVIRQTDPKDMVSVRVDHGSAVGSSNSESVTANVLWDSNTWKHFAITYDPGDATLKFWLNGQYVGVSTGGTGGYNANNSSTAYLAYQDYDGFYYEGTMDDLWMLKGQTLTDTQAMELYKYRS